MATLLTFALALILARGLWNASRDPVIQRASIELADWPAGAPPISVLHFSDVHMADPDLSESRLQRLIAEFSALKPDLVLIAGDLKSGKRFSNRHYSPGEIATTLARLKAPLGVVAVLGNHDYWHDPDAQAKALRKRGVVVLDNEAIRRGPLVIGGIADEITDHDDVPATFAAMDGLGKGSRILLTHGPDIVPELPEKVDAIFTGHTHCGQIVMPFVGALNYSSRFGDRFACGRIEDGGQTLFVGAGLGTSIVPLRYGAPPSLWLVTLGPKRAKVSQSKALPKTREMQP